MATAPISYSDLEKLLNEAFGLNTHIRDRNYAFVNEDWLIRKAENTLKSNKRCGLSFGPRWDCDDFSVDLVNSVAKDHARTGNSEAEGIAVGWVEYYDEEVGRHILVWFLTPDLEIKFIEPQTAKLRELSEKEREMVCYAWV